jgi:hypothetical protein
MCRQETKPEIERIARAIAAAVSLGAALAGCSDIYYARRDTIALSAGDSVAANAVEQMVDPWPAHSGDTKIAFNGQKMQSAVERYRTNKVTPPVNPTAVSDAANPQAAQAATLQGSSSSGSSGSGSSAPSGNSGQ